MAYVRLYPYPGEGFRAVGWAFVFGSYNTLENQLVLYDPTYLLSFGSILYVATAAVWVAISALLVRSIQYVSEEESRLFIAWTCVIVAFVSQMILPGLLLQYVTASHYGFVSPLPVQSAIALLELVRRRVPSVPQLITVVTVLTPYAVEEFYTMIFAYGLTWHFPFWEFYHGSGEGGNFAYFLTFGLGVLPFYLEALVTAILVTTGMMLAVVLRRAKSDARWYTIGWISALSALMIQIVIPLIVIPFLLIGLPYYMVARIIPIPTPSVLAIIGLIMIRRSESLQDSSGIDAFHETLPSR